MKNFKNYIFDLGAVIADINTQSALDGFRALSVPEEELRYDEGPTAKIMQNYQLGLLTTDEFCDAIIGRSVASMKPTRQQVADAWNTIIVGIPQQKIDALRTLKKRANVYLLSNTTELHWQKCLKQVIRYIAALQTRDAANPTNNSHDATNPTNDTYDAATPTINASNTVFLDDNLANVQSAMNCGISGIHVTPDYDWIANLI